jgi:hypothetical protein
MAVAKNPYGCASTYVMLQLFFMNWPHRSIVCQYDRKFRKREKYVSGEKSSLKLFQKISRKFQNSLINLTPKASF